MNIKGLVGPQIMPSVRAPEKVERGIHSDMTHDRDANGQQAFGDGQPEHGPMSDEQFQKALQHLRDLPAVKEHGWIVELALEDGLRRFVLIKDASGNLIRRIPERDLWTLEMDDKSSKGHLLKKTA